MLFETDGEDINVKVTITNNTGEFANVFWMFEPGEDYPFEWGTIICDDTLCYLEDRFKSNPNLPNPMPPDYSFDFKFSLKAYGHAGSSYAILHVYDDPECENEVATTSPPSVSVDEQYIKRISVYPNPTQDYFEISNDENVKSIDVINSVGQILMRAPHKVNEQHSIASLSSGTLIVVLKDENDDILKSLYLTKQ